MTERSGGYRGLARGLAVAGMLGAVVAAMTTAASGGVLLGCRGQDLLIPATATD